MEDVNDLIREYGLEQDEEHVIIPIPGKNGNIKRYFLLKRRYIRIVYPSGHFADYPLREVIEATLRYPELPLSEALYQVHRETEQHEEQVSGDRKPE